MAENENTRERICSECGVINKNVINNCSICGSVLKTISIKNYFDSKQVVVFTFVPLLWFLLILYFFNFFGLLKLKEINPILVPFRHFIILLFVITFSYLLLKLGGEWHTIALIDDGFCIYRGYYTKIIKVTSYYYSEIEVFCKLITLRYASLVFKANTNDKTDSFVTKNIKIAEMIINNLEGKEIPSHEFEKEFSTVTGFK